MDIVFYSVWRNWYIKREIRNIICRDLVIEVLSIKELHNNHQYLSLFTDRDKLDNNIYIRYTITDEKEFNQYISSDYKHLVNHIAFYNPVFGLNCKNLPSQTIHKLSCCLGTHTRISNNDNDDDIDWTLPQSLIKLEVSLWLRNESIRNKKFDVDVLSNLPSSLRYLVLPRNYMFSSRVELPGTLEDIEYTLSRKDSIHSLSYLVVPVNKTYDNITVRVTSLEDLVYMHTVHWVTNLIINTYDLAINDIKQYVPTHIKQLHLTYDRPLLKDTLPQSLTKLTLVSRVEINRLVLADQITYLNLNLYSRSFDQPIQKGMLPSMLKVLSIPNYNMALLPDTLPHCLKKLILKSFNQRLDEGVLPHSLQHLRLPSFNRPLKENVLPPYLKSLKTNKYSGNSRNMHPSTLIPSCIKLQNDFKS